MAINLVAPKASEAWSACDREEHGMETAQTVGISGFE